MPLPRPTRQHSQKEETIRQTKPVAAEPLNPADFLPSDTFRFDPKPNITMEELVDLVKLFWHHIDFDFDRFISLEPDLQRHFVLAQKI